MEWKDQDAGQTSDLQDNRDHYEVLVENWIRNLFKLKRWVQNIVSMSREPAQPGRCFPAARAEAESSEVSRWEAWKQLLSLNGWEVNTNFMTLDLAAGISSIFRGDRT